MSVKSYAVILLTGALSACQQTSAPVKASLGEGWQLVWQDGKVLILRVILSKCWWITYVFFNVVKIVKQVSAVQQSSHQQYK